MSLPKNPHLRSMNAHCLRHRLLAALLAVAGPTPSPAQSASGLLLPFPPEAAVETSDSGPDGAIPGSNGTPPDAVKAADSRRALELAQTFLRRQQMEVANSVPRRGDKILQAPLPTGSSGASRRSPIAAASTELPIPDERSPGASGPASELLPMPGDGGIGAPLDSTLPDTPEMLPAGAPENAGDSPDYPADSEVPRTDLAPTPAYGGVEDQDRRGPVFRVNGAQAFAVARARGFRFTPAGGIGPRDGVHTAASQFPNLLTSEVHGTLMSQLRPPPAWSVSETSNTFFMFCDANYNAVRLAPGWRVRGIKLDGPNWRWVACPRSGANTVSFSIRVYSYKGQPASTSVQLAGLTLEGPEGAVDWKDAFPWINGRGPARNSAPSPGSESSAMQATAGTGSAEPELPR
jgi:hypothetical protein